MLSCSRDKHCLNQQIILLIKRTLWKFHLTQILNESTFATYSSIHVDEKIYPIEIPYKKVLSLQYLLTTYGIQQRDGKMIFESDNIIDACIHNNLIFIHQIQQLIVYNVETNESYSILGNQRIDSFILNYPRVAIESSYYYIFDDKNRSLIKVGNTEKNKRFGCVFYNSFLFCGRPNGILWKAKMNGEVQSSYKFIGLRFNQLFLIGEYLFNNNQNNWTIISIDNMSVFKTIEMNQPCFLEEKVLYFDSNNIYTLRIIKLQDALNIYAKENDLQAIQLFKENKELQTYENSLILLKFESKEIAHIQDQLQEQSFQFHFKQKREFVNDIQLIKQNIVNVKNCVKWIQNEIIISKCKQKNLNKIIFQIKKQTREQKGLVQLQKFIKASKDLNQLHIKILEHKWDLNLVQKHFKYCRNLNLEWKYLIQLIVAWIRRRNGQLKF